MPSVVPIKHFERIDELLFHSLVILNFLFHDLEELIYIDVLPNGILNFFNELLDRIFVHVVGDGLHAGGAHHNSELFHRDGAFAVLGED